MKKFVIILSVISLLLLTYTLYQINRKQSVSVEINIEKGMHTTDIAFLLEKEGVISDPYIFILMVKLRNSTLKAGYYSFKGDLSIFDVLNMLEKGYVKEYLFTIIPGDNLITIAEKLQNEGIVEKEKFLRFVFDKNNVKAKNLEGDSFEGYFPPETYRIPYKSDLNGVINIFLKEFEKKYLPYKDKFKDKSITLYEGMIIASMVEKEAFLKEEKPIIAGVIFNRLKKGMRLQIDATVIYGLMLKNRYSGKLRKDDMKFDSPYNTYIYKGLPPTPICSFSLSSLDAVINPKAHNYLYYVLSKDRKSHIFTDNYDDHLKNIELNLKSK
ncbi:MAG: endolytic transglycosylase MltG [Hydrogenothermaceae bacterium]|nr:endolytic transglycosylase MltG [Hydrogenothermaceae bacterium]